MNKFNRCPTNWREITNEEFTEKFFLYMKDEPEFRQIRPNFMSVYLFPIAGTVEKYGEDGLGIAICRDGKMRKFGNDLDWIEFERNIASQFRGDNS